MPVIADESGQLQNPLTDREMDVLEEIARGHSNEKIADSLSIEISTVKTHNRSIISKLGVSDRHKAVLVAVSQGWLSEPAPTAYDD